MDLLPRIHSRVQGILADLRPIYLNPDDSIADNNPVPESINFNAVQVVLKPN